MLHATLFSKHLHIQAFRKVDGGAGTHKGLTNSNLAAAENGVLSTQTVKVMSLGSMVLFMKKQHRKGSFGLLSFKDCPKEDM
jgi:hypothetical protein